MFAMKKEMLPILSHVPDVGDSGKALTRAACRLDAVCRACDGSPDTVDAVHKAADALRAASLDCYGCAYSAHVCARRCCDELT
jgi:hypothetical protein